MTQPPPTAPGRITATLSQFLASLTYDRLPATVVAAMKAMLLDSLGTTLAANTLGEGCRELVDVVRSAGGAPESTLIGFGVKVPALQAALANGAMAHALNFDAVGPGHLGATVPAPLAAAERAGDVDGRELIVGLAAGAELMARLAISPLAAGNTHPRTLEGQVLGYFGAAAGAGRILRLTPDQLHSALGLALMQTAGTMQVVFDGDPPGKAIYTGFPNHGGMLAALLAKQGVGTACAAVEGEAGLLGFFYDGKYVSWMLDHALGEQWWVLGIRFKPWATSHIAHPFVEAALNLVRAHGIRGSADIARVTARGGLQTRIWFEPVEHRKIPTSAASAANSIFYLVAKALVNGAVTLADFSTAGLMQADVHQLIDRMDYSLEPELRNCGIVEVTTHEGRRFVERVDEPHGHPDRPMTYSEIAAKFSDCARYADRPLAPHAVETIIELVADLERVRDVRQITDLLNGAG